MKKKLKTLDKVLIILGIFLFVFIVATVVIYTVKDWAFDTLISMVLGGSSVEAIATASITITKAISEKKDGDKDDVNIQSYSDC